MHQMNRNILRLAVPNIISNVTVPLLGMVDTAIAGRLGDTVAIGALGIGSTIFNMIYWTCGFLRMGTSGITAQAYGARNLRECGNILLRALGVGIFIALLLVVFRNPVGRLSLGLMKGSEGAQRLAAEYFYARIWAAPASISLFAIHGWFIGMQNSRAPMVVSIISNIINIVFSCLFVFRYDMGIAGVAWGTVVAQYSGVLLSAIIWLVYYRRIAHYVDMRQLLDVRQLLRFFNINKDIFIRTLFLVTVYTFFTAASSRFGDTVLATNTLLMQLYTLFSYISDGFAFAAESLTGRYVGARNPSALKDAISKLIVWSFGIAVLYVVVYLVAWGPILSIFNPSAEVLAVAGHYIVWIIAVPIAGALPFLIDGILLGATQTRLLRNTMFLAAAIYFGLYYATVNVLGNNALWLSFVVFIAMRGVLLMAATRNLNPNRLISRAE